uniref:ORF33 n=1 Tax=Malaco herpesvirus 1 TaxID=3031797 RepID=A0AA48SIQ1_9VIRU|nr:TPA_asm: ORF33 [Malaco herpesvirus 1]
MLYKGDTTGVPIIFVLSSIGTTLLFHISLIQAKMTFNTCAKIEAELRRLFAAGTLDDVLSGKPPSSWQFVAKRPRKFSEDDDDDQMFSSVLKPQVFSNELKKDPTYAPHREELSEIEKDDEEESDMEVNASKLMAVLQQKRDEPAQPEPSTSSAVKPVRRIARSKMTKRRI